MKRRSAKLLEADRRIVDLIEQRSVELSAKGDGEILSRTEVLRRRAIGGTALDSLLPECFALVKEAAWRTLGQRAYDEQMLAGVALSRGRLVEMQTGEGKTLAAVAPVALAALAGHGVHVLTFNDYLARRDATWMGPVFERLGFSVAFVEDGMDTAARHRAYAADVTYLTVKEAGFDFLRDGLCLDPADQVHRGFRHALVDEADSILIDEARIPLVIAGDEEAVTVDLPRLAELARELVRGHDFATDEYGRNVFLTEVGTRRAEAFLGLGDLSSERHLRLAADLRNAAHAEALLRRDVDYIVRHGRVELVDELTGRVAEKRQWPDGLQAAVEAKEGLLPRPEGKVLGSITVQHFLGRYERLCGMTATARSSAEELRDVYGLEVVAVPTHRPSARSDHPDQIFASAAAKRRALVHEVARVHATGRPILVGTVSVEESERLAGELAAVGIDSRVLNAKNDAEEAVIVAEAGALGAVTISTNMAGRGTDIRLGGSAEVERDAVVALGGLYLIGTNRHESRRIDDQLRGRAGRQGDPGSSRFFVSFEDPLMERYSLRSLLPEMFFTGAHQGVGGRVEHPMVRREVARVQRIVEGEHGAIRKRLLSFSLLIERQREELHRWRLAVLEGRDHEGVLATLCSDRWTALSNQHGEALLAGIERHLTLLIIDRAWADHLAEMQTVRDQVHLVTLDGRDPLAEFFRTARAAFDLLVEQIDETIVTTFERLEVTADGVDWEKEGLNAPSSTWTYMVDDHVFGANTFMTLANRASFGVWAVLVCWWILLPWAFVMHIGRWRKRRNKRSDAINDPTPDAKIKPSEPSVIRYRRD